MQNNFILVGVAKCGTSSIYKKLKEHPQILIPQKETFHFIREIIEDYSQESSYYRSSSEIIDQKDYYSKYEKKNFHNQIIGEIATSYLYYYNTVIPKILETFGSNIPIIIILRNPYKRAFSQFLHMKRDGFETLDFLDGLKNEEQRVSKNWDFMWRYKGLSQYYEAVHAYVQNFKKVHICLYDNLLKDETSFLLKILDFLEVKQSRNFEMTLRKGLSKVNVGGVPRSIAMHQFLTKKNAIKTYINKIPHKTLIYKFFKSVRNFIHSSNLKKGSSLNQVEKEYLSKYIDPDIEKLEQLLNVDLSHWKK